MKGVAVEPAAWQFHEFPDIGISGDGDGASGRQFFLGGVVNRHRQTVFADPGGGERPLSVGAVHHVPQIVLQPTIRDKLIAGVNMRIKSHGYTPRPPKSAFSHTTAL